MNKPVYECPVFDLYAYNGEALKASDVIAVPYQSIRHGILHSFYTLGSVAAYAERYNECPVAAVDRAKSFGHELYYAFANGVMLTAEKQARTKHFVVNHGDMINAMDKSFLIAPAANRNIKLIEA